MPDEKEVMELIALLGSEDEILRERAQTEIRGIGVSAVPYLNRARGQRNRYSYVEVFRMLAIIGDDLYTDGGLEKINKSIIKTLEFGAKSTMKSTPEEVKEISAQALRRWGLEVPEPAKPKVYHCHVCNRPSTELRVMRCFVPTCNNFVCQDHTHIIETRFGRFDGSGGAWFCTAEHKEQALKDPSIMK